MRVWPPRRHWASNAGPFAVHLVHEPVERSCTSSGDCYNVVDNYPSVQGAHIVRVSPQERHGPVTRGPSQCTSCTNFCVRNGGRTQASDPGPMGSTLVLVSTREAGMEGSIRCNSSE